VSEPIRPHLSVVIPVWNEEDTLRALYDRTSAALDDLEIAWELVFVDDGSTDSSADVLADLRGTDGRVRIIRLSRNFGQQLAITAGLDFAEGDAVVVMDADLQDPPEVIARMIDRWNEGYQVVHAVRSRRDGESWFKLVTAKVFYRLLDRVTDVKITLDAGEFRLMDRAVVLELRRLREHHRFMRGLSSWVGFRQTRIEFDRDPRIAGTTKFGLRQLLRLAVNAITSFSFLPLQIATYLGILVSIASVIGIVVVLILRFVVGVAFLVGQTTTLLAILLLGGVQLLAIGTIGTYLGRIYDEVRGRPLYLVSEAIGFVGDDEGRR
jgi:dolichol-phosphate mannosyltransferase